MAIKLSCWKKKKIRRISVVNRSYIHSLRYIEPFWMFKCSKQPGKIYLYMNRVLRKSVVMAQERDKYFHFNADTIQQDRNCHLSRIKSATAMSLLLSHFSSELWEIYCEYFEENWPWFKNLLVVWWYFNQRNKLIICLDNHLSPFPHQGIFWTIADD